MSLFILILLFWFHNNVSIKAFYFNNKQRKPYNFPWLASLQVRVLLLITNNSFVAYF
jgi:hypothetical protein